MKIFMEKPNLKPKQPFYEVASTEWQMVFTSCVLESSIMLVLAPTVGDL